MSAPTVPTEAADVAWDLSDLLAGVDGTPEEAVTALLDDADHRAGALGAVRGRVAQLDGAELVAHLDATAELQEVVGRAVSYAQLRYTVDTADPVLGALLQRATERATAISTALLFFDLEWAALDDDHVARLLDAEGMAPYAHHLERVRAMRPFLLSEPEERVLSEKSVTGPSAWARLFEEQTSAIEVDVDGRSVTLGEALSLLLSNDGEVRRRAAASVTAALAPGLRTRAYIYNTLLQDKAIDDRLRRLPTWVSSRNIANEASDESVDALVEAVRARYDLPQRWYRLKARVLGVDRLADHDRMASLADDDGHVEWEEARSIVLDSYASFSPELADVARRFFDEGWIDAPPRPGKRAGAFCSYTVPSVHPYVFLNYTATRNDVLTLAHELGHGLHAYLAREQGPFHQSTPLTLAETASVFGETVTFGRILETCETPQARLALLAENIEGGIATVFRQTAMNRFEHAAHTARRTEGELSVERFGALWAETQAEMLGDTVEISEGYRTWWSYVPHFIAVPGYVYAYAYGQLLALSVYKRYTEQGGDFVPRYLHLLSAGGSMAPEDLGRIVGCDLADPGFWDGGLAIIEEQIDAAETAAHEAGRL
jgi:oligoendopeptidase F